MIYSHKLKGIGLCFKLLRSALCSNMANFGVFKLYNDKSLENAFEVRTSKVGCVFSMKYFRPLFDYSPQYLHLNLQTILNLIVHIII